MVCVGLVNDNDDPNVDVNAMIAEVGAESVATVQALGHVLKDMPLDLRETMHPASNLLAHCMNSCLVCPTKGLITCLRQRCVRGAPTRARNVNDRSAAAFDMHAFAQVLSQFSSKHVPAVNVTGGKAAAIAKSDKPKWDVICEPFHTFKRRVVIWAESHGIEHLLTNPPTVSMSEFECHNVARRTILLALSATDTDYTADTTYLCEAW